MVLKHMKRYSSLSLKIRTMQIKTLLRYHFSPVRQELKSLTIHFFGKAMVKQRFSSIAVGMQNGTVLVRGNLAIFNKTTYVVTQKSHLSNLFQ